MQRMVKRVLNPTLSGPTIMLEIEFIPNATSEVLKSLGRFRTEVWRAESDVNRAALAGAEWTDATDWSADHWVVRQSGRVVAAARLSVHDRIEDVPYSAAMNNAAIPTSGPFGSINRLVVARSHRRQGIASLLDYRRLERARELGVAVVIAVAARSRRCALLRMGFSSLGPASDTSQLLRLDSEYSVLVHLLEKPLEEAKPRNLI